MAIALTTCVVSSLVPAGRGALGASTYAAVGGVNFSGDMLTEGDTALASDMDAVSATGSRYFRLAFRWDHVQYGGPLSWSWSQLDRVVAFAQARGLSTVAVVLGSPPWASAVPLSTMAPPRSPSDWYTFVKAAARRYIPKGVTTWELWNEPNIMPFWVPGPNALDYVQKVLVPGARAVRSAAAALGTSATVVSAGLSPATTGFGTIPPIEFLNRVYTAGGKGYFDAAALHPYTTPYAPMTVTTGVYGTFYNSPAFYQVMVDHGEPGKKVWATEIGYPTGPCGSRCVSEQTQAQDISLAYGQWVKWTFTGPMIWFQERDSGTNPSAPGQNFGLIRHDGTAKPGFGAFKTQMATLY